MLREKMLEELETGIIDVIERWKKRLKQENTGHWIKSGTYLECDDCGCGCYVGDLVNGDFNYCPECGRKMEVY